jgi:tRNA(fMet)-specific endonuclease VapC
LIIHIFKKKIAFAHRLQNLEEVFISSTAIGELYFGAYASISIQKKISEIEDFQKKCTVLNVTPETGLLFGKIKAQLKAKGKPIPENDIWIAASALEHELPLYTTDNHFRDIENLTFLE